MILIMGPNQDDNTGGTVGDVNAPVQPVGGDMPQTPPVAPVAEETPVAPETPSEGGDSTGTGTPDQTGNV